MVFEHHANYYKSLNPTGSYTLRSRTRKKMPKAKQATGIDEPDTPYSRKLKMIPPGGTALIKAVYECDPLKCPKRCTEPAEVCGGSMRIVSFIEKCQSEVIEKILRHCGLWKVAPPRPPPEPALDTVEEPVPDYGFFDRVCI